MGGPPEQDKAGTPGDEKVGLGLAGWGTIAGICASIVTVLAFVLGDSSSRDPESEPESTSSPPAESLEDFGARVLAEYHGGNYDAVWETYHPAVKEVIDEAEYVRCEQLAGRAAVANAIKFDGIGEFTVDMEGVPASVSQVNYRVTGTIPEGEVTVTETVLVVNDGDLAQVPLQEHYDAYVEGRCPTPNLADDSDVTDQTGEGLGASSP